MCLCQKMIENFILCLVLHFNVSFSSTRQNNLSKTEEPVKDTLTFKLGLDVKRIMNIVNESG